MPAYYTFAKASDRSVIDFFLSIRSSDYDRNLVVDLGGGLAFEIAKDGVIPGRFSRVMEDSDYLIQSVSYGDSSMPLWANYNRSAISPFIDRIEYDVQKLNDQAAFENFFHGLRHHFSAGVPVNLTQGAQNALEQSQAILNRVSEAAASIAEHTVRRQSEIDRHLEALRSENAVALERSQSQLQADFDGRMRALDEREKLIVEREETLDDRQNTHVRRAIQDKMAKLPAEIMEEGLLRRSDPRFFSMVAIASMVSTGLAALAVLTGVQLAQEQISGNQVLFLEATRVLLGLGAGAGFWFVIRQAAERYRQAAHWEQQLNTFRLDVERASFLIEGDLEARKLGANGLPEIMLQAFSRGLFVGEKTEQQDDAVGSAMVHLLSRPASLKIGPSGAEATFDGKGLKKSGKEMEGKAE